MDRGCFMVFRLAVLVGLTCCAAGCTEKRKVQQIKRGVENVDAHAKAIEKESRAAN